MGREAALPQRGLPLGLRVLPDGQPPYIPIFVIARTTGWCTHMIEQLDNNRLIRPSCIYEGPAPTPYVPIGSR
ncbi:MAG: citrate/2-methylcitrate synthase [Fimbriimonadaceae bacterium]